MAEDTASTFGTPEMMDKQEDSSGNSTGKAMPLKSRKKEVPHYLRASTGSCHDLCKYGRKHISEEKPWRVTTKKIVKKAPDISIETLKPGLSERKKTLADKKKNVIDDACEIIKREVVNSPSGVSSRLKPKALIKSAGDETFVKQKESLQVKKRLESSPVSGSHSSRNVDVLKPKVLTKSYSALAMPKSKGPKVTPEKVDSSVLKPKMVKQPGGKDIDANRKKAAALRVASKVSLTPKSSVSPRLSLRQGGKSLRKSQSLKAATSSVPNQKPRNVKRTEELKQLDGYPVEEKTLHIVEMEIKSKVSEHDENQQYIVEPSPPPLTPSTQEDEDRKEYDVYTVSEVEEYEYPSGNNESESAEEEGVAAQKLQIRKGKGADADSVYDGPRKLKFRKGRDVGDDKEQNSQVRRSFKKRDEIIEEETSPSGEQVVLRHQDVQERDALVLFNNVIEETASKLVEARNSKVKALVGAFETVISLQESKPPANSST